MRIVESMTGPQTLEKGKWKHFWYRASSKDIEKEPDLLYGIYYYQKENSVWAYLVNPNKHGKNHSFRLLPQKMEAIQAVLKQVEPDKDASDYIIITRLIDDSTKSFVENICKTWMIYGGVEIKDSTVVKQTQQTTQVLPSNLEPLDAYFLHSTSTFGTVKVDNSGVRTFLPGDAKKSDELGFILLSQQNGLISLVVDGEYGEGRFNSLEAKTALEFYLLPHLFSLVNDLSKCLLTDEEVQGLSTNAGIYKDSVDNKNMAILALKKFIRTAYNNLSEDQIFQCINHTLVGAVVFYAPDPAQNNFQKARLATFVIGEGLIQKVSPDGTSTPLVGIKKTKDQRKTYFTTRVPNTQAKDIFSADNSLNVYLHIHEITENDFILTATSIPQMVTAVEQIDNSKIYSFEPSIFKNPQLAGEKTPAQKVLAAMKHPFYLDKVNALNRIAKAVITRAFQLRILPQGQEPQLNAMDTNQIILYAVVDESTQKKEIKAKIVYESSQETKDIVLTGLLDSFSDIPKPLVSAYNTQLKAFTFPLVEVKKNFEDALNFYTQQRVLLEQIALEAGVKPNSFFVAGGDDFTLLEIKALSTACLVGLSERVTESVGSETQIIGQSQDMNLDNNQNDPIKKLRELATEQTYRNLIIQVLDDVLSQSKVNITTKDGRSISLTYVKVREIINSVNSAIQRNSQKNTVGFLRASLSSLVGGKTDQARAVIEAINGLENVIFNDPHISDMFTRNTKQFEKVKNQLDYYPSIYAVHKMRLKIVENLEPKRQEALQKRIESLVKDDIGILTQKLSSLYQALEEDTNHYLHGPLKKAIDDFDKVGTKAGKQPLETAPTNSRTSMIGFFGSPATETTTITTSSSGVSTPGLGRSAG